LLIPSAASDKADADPRRPPPAARRAIRAAATSTDTHSMILCTLLAGAAAHRPKNHREKGMA